MTKPNLFQPDDGDFAQQLEWQRELWGQVFPKIRIRVVDRGTTNVHEIYHEAGAETRYKPEQEVKAFVEQNPSSQALKKYGIDESREAIIHFLADELMEKGLVSADSGQELVGAVVNWDNDDYLVLSQHRVQDSYWATTNIPFHISVTVNRLHKGA